MDELPAYAAAVALASSVAGGAMADLIELSEFLGVDVDHFTWPFAPVAAGRFGRFQSAQLVDAQPLPDTTYRRSRHADDLFAEHALAAEALDALDGLRWRRLA